MIHILVVVQIVSEIVYLQNVYVHMWWGCLCAGGCGDNFHLFVESDLVCGVCVAFKANIVVG